MPNSSIPTLGGLLAVVVYTIFICLCFSFQALYRNDRERPGLATLDRPMVTVATWDSSAVRWRDNGRPRIGAPYRPSRLNRSHIVYTMDRYNIRQPGDTKWFQTTSRLHKTHLYLLFNMHDIFFRFSHVSIFGCRTEEGGPSAERKSTEVPGTVRYMQMGIYRRCCKRLPRGPSVPRPVCRKALVKYSYRHLRPMVRLACGRAVTVTAMDTFVAIKFLRFIILDTYFKPVTEHLELCDVHARAMSTMPSYISEYTPTRRTIYNDSMYECQSVNSEPEFDNNKATVYLVTHIYSNPGYLLYTPSPLTLFQHTLEYIVSCAAVGDASGRRVIPDPLAADTSTTESNDDPMPGGADPRPRVWKQFARVKYRWDMSRTCEYLLHSNSDTKCFNHYGLQWVQLKGRFGLLVQVMYNSSTVWLNIHNSRRATIAGPNQLYSFMSKYLDMRLKCFCHTFIDPTGYPPREICTEEFSRPSLTYRYYQLSSMKGCIGLQYGIQRFIYMCYLSEYNLHLFPYFMLLQVRETYNFNRTTADRAPGPRVKLDLRTDVLCHGIGAANSMPGRSGPLFCVQTPLVHEDCSSVGPLVMPATSWAGNLSCHTVLATVSTYGPTQRVQLSKPPSELISSVTPHMRRTCVGNYQHDSALGKHVLRATILCIYLISANDTDYQHVVCRVNSRCYGYSYIYCGMCDSLDSIVNLPMGTNIGLWSHTQKFCSPWQFSPVIMRHVLYEKHKQCMLDKIPDIEHQWKGVSLTNGIKTVRREYKVCLWHSLKPVHGKYN